MMTSLQQQFEFLSEIERLREVDRQNILLNGSRVENSAEHSWHIMLYAWVLAEHSSKGLAVPAQTPSFRPDRATRGCPRQRIRTARLR